jgi:hypothetical protein
LDCRKKQATKNFLYISCIIVYISELKYYLLECPEPDLSRFPFFLLVVPDFDYEKKRNLEIKQVFMCHYINLKNTGGDLFDA